MEAERVENMDSEREHVSKIQIIPSQGMEAERVENMDSEREHVSKIQIIPSQGQGVPVRNIQSRSEYKI